jgi:ribose transport system permease protein
MIERFKRGAVSPGLYAALLSLIVAALVMQAVTGVSFFTLSNMLNVARNFSMLGLVALGQTLVIMSGGLDLSVVAVISTGNILAASLINGNDALVFPVLLFTLVVGAAIGTVNGLLVTKRGVPPFIATLGVSIVVNGLRLIATGGIPKGNVPDLLKEMGTGNFLGLPWLVIIFIMVAIFFYILLAKSSYGRRLRVTGCNPEVAELCGINKDRVIITAYLFCGALGAGAGVFLAGYTGIADNWAGNEFDINSIAAAVLGGAAIGGGSGSVQGTVIGSIILLLITNLAILAHLPIQSQMMVKGLVIILALGLFKRGKKS